MSVEVLAKKRHGGKEISKEAKSLEEAYERGFFQSGMPIDEFLGRILSVNPELRIHRGSTHTGLFDTQNNRFVCGISRMSRIPRFTVLKHDFSKDRKLNYSDEHGNITSRQIINKDEEKGKVLCRSWIATFNILKGQGYEVNDSDIDY